MDEVLRPQHVGLDALARMPLQKRKVLVCGCMEDDLKFEFREQLLDSLAVPDVGDDQLVAVQQGLSVELHLQPVEVRLVVIEHVKRCRTERLDLAAQLTSYRAAGTRDQNTLALDDRAGGRPHDVHLLPPEQPIHAKAAQIADPGVALESCSE